LISISFKDVGQGDSIILEWTRENKKCFGIIDCNIINGRNPVLDHLIKYSVTNIEFLILSHFHYDHYSGMADLFQYCISNNIKVKYFYHSLHQFLGDFYNRTFTSQKIQASILDFFQKYELFDDYIEDSINVNSHLAPLLLTDKISLSFLAPSGKVYTKFAKQLSRKVNKITTTQADVNKLATIIAVQNESHCILLTSDAVKKSFEKINKRISPVLVLIQVPHHGSWLNVQEKFWNSMIKEDKCPAIFSVGDEPKDKLPNQKTVEFFHKSNYDIHSTNEVYGIKEYFKLPTPPILNKSNVLNSFSKLRKVTNPMISTKFQGDHNFNLLQ
jgi:competence protein ComEC